MSGKKENCKYPLHCIRIAVGYHERREMVKLYTVQRGKIQKYSSYCEVFGLNVVDNIQIAAIGSGGKSTILSEIAREYAKAKRTVISTTTTHIWMPDNGVFEEDIQKVKEALRMNPIIIVGNRSNESQKLSGVSFEFLSQLRKVADCVAIEADGSRQLPLKVPNEREPVIPPNTELILVVAGISALGKPIREVVHRPELAEKVLHKSVNDIVNITDIALLLNYQKSRKASKAIPVLNQVDTKREWKYACRIAELLPYCVIRSHC